MSTTLSGGNFMKTILFALLSGLLLTGCQSSQSTETIPAVRSFQLERYLGTWYEIARLPHKFERGMTDVSAVYKLQENGKVQVVNSGMKNGKKRSIRGVAHFKGESSVGELRVSFFRPFYGDYRIIALSPDYSCAIVTSSTREYLWILAREKKLPDAELQKLLEQIRKWGFDTSKLEYPQTK